MAATILAGGATAGVSNNLCVTASASVPAGKASIAGQKYQSNPTEWTVDQATPGKGFACLRFSVTDPQYFMYEYTGSTGASGAFNAKGMGDLNGDGTTSTFSLSGAVTGGVVFVAPNFLEDKPEE
jgi:type IV pilus assembly protein PilA